MKKDRKIGDNIRLLREARGFSQTYMAEQLSITQQAYSSVKKNRRIQRLND